MLITITVDTAKPNQNQFHMEFEDAPSEWMKINDRAVGEMIKRFNLPTLQEWVEIDDEIFQISF